MTATWRLVPLDASGLPSASLRSLPEPTAACDLCERRPETPMATVLIVDGPAGLPVPFLICANCRRSLQGLHVLLESALMQR